MFKNTIPVQYATLMKPLFLRGKNFGEKLSKTNDTALDYDMTRKELYVSYNGRVSVIPSTGVANFEPVNPGDVGYQGEQHKPVKTHVSHPAIADIGQAQVSTPTGYVFEGPGKGKTKT